MKYAYLCPIDGEVESPFAQDTITCRCGGDAKRIRRIAVHTKPTGGRFDFQVGKYVRNEGEFMSELKRQQEAESAKLGRDVVLTTCDSRDKEALAELHMTTPEAREADLEPTKKKRYDEASA